MESKYKILKFEIQTQYPTFNIFINNKRLVIEDNKQPVLTYYPGNIVSANIRKIPHALMLIRNYDAIREYNG